MITSWERERDFLDDFNVLVLSTAQGDMVTRERESSKIILRSSQSYMVTWERQGERERQFLDDFNVLVLSAAHGDMVTWERERE